MTRVLALLLRVVAGYGVAWWLAVSFGAGGDPGLFLGAVFVVGGLAAILLDVFDETIAAALWGGRTELEGEQPTESL